MYLRDPLWLDVLENLFEFRAVFCSEWQQRLTRITNRDAAQFTADFDLLGVAAAFHVAEEREELVQALSMKEVVEDPKGFMEGAVERLLTTSHERRGAELQKNIRQAEEKKDMTLLNKLTKEFIEWQKRKS